MIDLQIEQPVTLRKAPRLPQLRRDGRPPHVSQLYRWASKGLKGHVLETIVIAGSRCTTSEAVDRWIAALTAGAKGEPAPARTPVKRKKDHQRANETLEREGW